MSRQESRRIVVAVAVTVMACQAPLPAQEAEGGASAPAAQEPPLIVAAQISTDRSTLTVSGVNLGTVAPTLSMGLSALRVTAVVPAGTVRQPDAVTATLPAELPPGTYLLALTRAVDEEVAIFYLAVPPVGAVYQ